MRFLKLLPGVLITSLLILVPMFALAQAFTQTQIPAVTQTQQPAVTGNSSFQLENPLGPNGKNFCDLIKSILDILLAIGIPVAVLFIVWAGFRFVWARGNQAELVNARRNFMYVIIGIAVFLGAWTLAAIITSTISTISGGSIQICGNKK